MVPPSFNPHPKFGAQSSNYCSDKSISCPYFIKFADSNIAEVENAQHEPHYPYSLIGVTMP